jgi:Flp pilus assembly protein TadB
MADATADRALVLGQMMDAVAYMAMSMRVAPSLHRAVLFAAGNVGEPLASRLRQLIVDVELRKYDSLEAAFLDLARTYDPGNEEFQQALHALRAAEMQLTPEGVDRALEHATGTLFEGVRQRMREYADGLQRPVFVLFSLGVVLPLMVGSMLPLISFGGASGATWLAILFMDVLFPLMFVIAARRVLARRPLVRRPLAIPLDDRRRALRLAAALGAGAALVALGLLCGHVATDVSEAQSALDSALADGSLARMDAAERAALESRADAPDGSPLVALAVALGHLPALWGVAAAFAIYYLPALRAPRRRRDEVVAIEDRLPDALFHLGSRIADGAPLERALRRAADGMDGEPVAVVLRRVLVHLTLKRTSSTEALFGREGALAGFPSDCVSASLRTVVEMVRKDVSGAGRAIVGTANHLRDLRRVDRDMASRLRSVTDMMQSTATVFAPVILGVTSALYLVIARLAPTLPSSSAVAAAPVPAATFALVLGVFVLALAAATMHFCARLTHGDDAIEARYRVARAMPVAVAVYSVASVVGQAVVA